MGYIMLKNVETTSDEKIMRGVWGGGAAYRSTFQREVTAQQPKNIHCGKPAEPSDEFRLPSTLIFELSDDT
jgi:hypothetical protein